MLLTPPLWEIVRTVSWGFRPLRPSSPDRGDMRRMPRAATIAEDQGRGFLASYSIGNSPDRRCAIRGQGGSLFFDVDREIFPDVIG
jgi:hypothetical protein